MDSPSAQRQITSFFANAARKGKQDGGVISKGMSLSDDFLDADHAGPATGSTSNPPRKRKALSDNIIDLQDLGLATESPANPPKRQRRQTAKEKAEEAKAAASNVQEFFPEPRGEPEVWADDRQSLCESLPYYQAFKSAAYTGRRFGYGWLLDNDNDVRGFMSDEWAITRFGGGFAKNEKTGKMERLKNQSLTSKEVLPFYNNMEEFIPVNLIIGAKNPHSPSKMPHRYNVAGSSMVTYIWSEKFEGMTSSKVRLQNINLQEPAWYSPKNSPWPPAVRDYVTKAACETCSSCDRSWSQVYLAGWMCLNDACKEHFLIGGETCTDLTFNPVWLDERSEWPQQIIPPLSLKPAPILADSNAPSMQSTTSLACWKGMVCPLCGRCNSRRKWDQWECLNEACTFVQPVKHTTFSPQELVEKLGFEFEGQAISYDSFESPVTKRVTEWPGLWRLSTYDVPDGGIVSHFHANAVINRQSGGANDILEALQGSKLGMERFSMGTASAEGLSLVRHFAINFGMPYKYVVSVDSRSFKDAPPIIMNVVNRLIWAGKKIVTDGTWKQFNELLCLGYMEQQAISYHDDGEKDLGPTIVSVSIGGEATMTIRMKAKYYFCLTNVTRATYDPRTDNVERGTQLWRERLALKELQRAAAAARDDDDGRSAVLKVKYKAALEAFFTALAAEKNKKSAPVVLTMDLRHGDMICMHGHLLQARYEHAVAPKGKLRFGLTCRFVKPENIAVGERWKGEFEAGAEVGYDGDAR